MTSDLSRLTPDEALCLATARAQAAAPGNGRAVVAAILTAAGRIYTATNMDHAQVWGAICAETAAIAEAVRREARISVLFSVAVNANGLVLPPRDSCIGLLEEYGPLARVALPDPDRPEGAGALTLGTLRARRVERAALLGVVLAGGRATRMGGADKGLLEVGGRRVIDHVLERLEPQVGAVVLNANGDPARFSALDLPVIPDALPEGVPDWPGPLAGVLAGMDRAAACGAHAVVTVAADTPFFPRDLVTRLLAHAAPSGLCLALSPDPEGRVQRHPTFGLWPVALREDLRAALQGGLRKIVAWTDRHGAGRAIFDSLPFDPFFNVNTPDDLARADEMARRL
jgi:molybdenum cofactor guanylyltransferase